ncbi:YwmB family TATA-box binding protein [Alicyclobacillus acidiphilus]|uniref:YwmB family TATA-box binding protein n=1 Tax=Alicyclobacillus acidiphilus TaxID=182455 RepID=UPI00082AC40F|nr:YwmB family TATA-box binding protein [Alicyclobacillus acidiphilus]
MKRMIVWVVGGVLAFTIFGHVLPAMASNSEAPVPRKEAEYLTQSFNATGAKATSFVIHDYSTVNQQFMSVSDLQNLSETIASEFGLTNVKAGKRVGQDKHIIELSSTWSTKTSLSIVLSSFHMTDGMPDSTILVLRARNETGNVAELAPQMSAVSTELRRLHISPQLDAYITGHVKPKLSQEQTDHVISKAFVAVKAERTEGLSSTLVTSISGYSSEGPTYILSNGKKMNLQVALHWDGYNHQTNVIVGTPIIIDPY